MSVVRELQNGDHLGPFVLVEPIGAGAMGVVWRAFDPRLERDVALKILAAGTLAREAERRRFRNEALALSRLSHPNVAAVHSFDTFDALDVLAMEFVGGERLDPSATRSEREVLELALQLADGLAAAHAAGVVHRDLKPENLRIALDGRLKILDFGIARLSARTDATTAVQTATATAADERSIAGTLPYMAPEQLRGEPGGARSDVWSAGVVLYELATGERPFGGATAMNTIAAILDGHTPPPSSRRSGLSRGFDRVVARALERDPAARFASGAELAVALRALARTTPRTRRRRLLPALGVAAAALAGVAALRLWHPAPGAVAARTIDALAVLPFADEGGSPDTRYLANEVPGAIIDTLGQEPGKKVIARSSSFRYRGSDLDLKTVAGALGVTAVLTGRVAVHGGEVTVSAELVDARDQAHVWGGHFTRPLAELSTLPELIADRVAASLRGGSAREGAVANTRPSDDPEAYRLYLRGRYESERWNNESPDRALGFYREALRHDPRYARAWAGIGEALAEKASPADMRDAKDALDRALAIDPELPEAHAVLGFWQFNERHWSDAERELRRAVELNPNLKNAQHWLSHLYLVLGRFDEALAASVRYVEIDPLSPDTRHHLGFNYLATGRYEDAARTSLEVLKIDPTFQMSYENLFCADAMLARGPDAIEAFFARRDGQEMDPVNRERLRAAFAAGGLRAFLLAAREYYRARGRHVQADFSMMLGDVDDAVRFYVTHAPTIVLNEEPFLPRLLHDPKNRALRAAFGLDQSTR